MMDLPDLAMDHYRMRFPHWAEVFTVRVAPDGHPVRHRVFLGGRGGGKSWTIAGQLLLRAREKPIRILCTREFQNSIRDSSKRLLEDTIDRMGFGLLGDGFFTVTEREIRGRNGSIILFVGLNGKDTAIKSFEGIDIVWVEEAASVRQSSIDALIPTVRRPGSELWWSYNPRYPTDPVDRLFRGDNPPPGMIKTVIHWNDNHWFPDVLRREMEYDRRRDPDKYNHVWLGDYVQRSDAQVFKRWWVMPFTAPDDALFRFGADFGFSRDPTVLVRGFIGCWAGEPGASAVIADQNGNCLFVDYEVYRVGCEIIDTPALFAGDDFRHPPRWENRLGERGIPGAATTRITADAARPETISHIKKCGLDVVAAIKGPGSVEEGVGFLTSYDIYVHPRCRHLADELFLYRYLEDKLTGAITSQLASKNNHVIDALRYAHEGARRARKGGFFATSSGTRISLGGSAERFPKYPWPDEAQELEQKKIGWASAPGRRFNPFD